MPPISEALDQDLFFIAVGKELGVPATEVEYLPEYWRGVVNTLWKWQDMQRKTKPMERKTKPKGR